MPKRKQDGDEECLWVIMPEQAAEAERAAINLTAYPIFRASTAEVEKLQFLTRVIANVTGYSMLTLKFVGSLETTRIEPDPSLN